MNLSDLLCKEIDCKCGKRHYCAVESVDIGFDTAGALIYHIESFGYKKLLVVMDLITEKVFGGHIVARLRKYGLNCSMYVIPHEEPIPNEEIIESVMDFFTPEIDCVVGVGAGTINDICKYASFTRNKPYMIVGTAASMDGYASSVAPLIVGGKKVTFPAHTPKVILASDSVLREAPEKLTAAGVGDLMGKYTCHADWKLSNAMTGEAYCEFVSGLTMKPLSMFVENLIKHDYLDYYTLMNCLIVSGIAMAFNGDSRPASGAEHHMSHYLEMKHIENGHELIPHGLQVGFFTLVNLRLYEFCDESIREDLPTVEFVETALKKAGCLTQPAQLGLTRELLKEIIVNARFVRDRYTILTYLADKNILEEAAEAVTNQMFSDAN